MYLSVKTAYLVSSEACGSTVVVEYRLDNGPVFFGELHQDGRFSLRHFDGSANVYAAAKILAVRFAQSIGAA